MTSQTATLARRSAASTGALADPVVITRRRRPGLDRAYVEVDGRLVGFRDLYTGVGECSVVEHLDLLMDATDRLVHLGSARPAA